MVNPRMDIADTDIQALVDQQLSWEEEKEIRAHLNDNPTAKARYQQLTLQKKQLQKWWQDIRSRHH